VPRSLGKLALVFTRYANLTLGGGSATAATMGPLSSRGGSGER
jgi:chromate transport protein ChrA